MKSFTLLAIAIFGCQYASPQIIESCSSLVYCQGELLDLVQRAGLFPDSKTFVDLTQKNSPNVTLEHFQALLDSTNNSPTTEDLRNFVAENFDNQTELESWNPSDYNANPEFLSRINDTAIRSFAQTIVQIWLILARKVSQSVFEEEDRHSLIPLPNGFIIPGGRFREIYYWDTYWIIKGLLISGMTDTVRGILDNFVSLVSRYGFVPNGSRVYYLNRSQPPLLSLMAGLYIDATNNITWLEQNVGLLEEEVNWWLNQRTTVVERFGRRHRLALYNCSSGTPRPESYAEDLKTCESFQNDEKVKCYQNIKSAAESGWDFSSKWLIGSDGSIATNLTLINTSRIIPVDLNAFLSGAFGELSRFFKLTGNNCKSLQWAGRQAQWNQAIFDILYDQEDGIWYDWDIQLSSHRKGFYTSNFAPLWAGAYNPLLRDQYGRDAVTYLENNNIENYLGGIPTSLLKSGQQWDLPNAWPPEQEIVVLGLKNTENQRAVEVSKLLARRTLTAYMIGFENTQEMFEKYDAFNVGEYGGGGEYTVQSGFGWTNGVALSFIELLELS